MSKHCSSIYFRCKTTVLVFLLLVTVMLLLTDLTSAPDDKCIGIKYCQKISEKVLPIPISILHTKSIANTWASTQKLSPILFKQYQYCGIDNPANYIACWQRYIDVSSLLWPLCSDAQAGLEPSTCESQVRCPTNSTTTPPRLVFMYVLW